MKSPDSKNIVNARIDANGNVIVGDGNTITVINLKEAAQYKALQAQLAQLDENLEETRRRIVRFPEVAEFKVDLLKYSEERNTKQQEIDSLIKEVLKLAEEFFRLPINTERLRLAKQFFEAGEFIKAQAVLDAEQMNNELEEAIKKEAFGKHLQTQAREAREKLANEYLILAQLTAIDFSQPDRFENTKLYFEQSLKAYRSPENLFAYALFLQRHNQFSETQPLYQEALEIYMALAKAHPQTYLPHVATVLNNLANLYSNRNEFDLAEQLYQGALAIYRKLINTNPQIYLRYVAVTLGNLANLHSLKHDFDQAKRLYQEALAIYRAIATNQQIYLPDLADALNNLANLHADQYEFDLAEQSYREVLAIYRALAEDNPQTYENKVATTLNNLALLYSDRKEFDQAELFYQEALAIYRTLTTNNPQTYLPNAADLLNNLAKLHMDKYEFDQGESNCQKALTIYRDLANVNPQTYLPYVAVTLGNLATLHSDRKEFDQAESTYQEALTIQRNLANVNPQTYLPNVAVTTLNMSTLYWKSIPDKVKSLAYAKEALWAALPFVGFLGLAQDVQKLALAVVKAWGEDEQAFLQKVVDSMK